MSGNFCAFNASFKESIDNMKYYGFENNGHILVENGISETSSLSLTSASMSYAANFIVRFHNKPAAILETGMFQTTKGIEKGTLSNTLQ